MNGNEETRDTALDTRVYNERKRWLFLGLPFTFTKYSLTPKSLQLNKGLLTSTQDDILLFRVMDVSIKRTLFQKMAGLGTLIIRSSDKTNPVLEIRNIKNCQVLKTALDERVENERLRMRFRSGELMGDFDQDADVDVN